MNMQFIGVDDQGFAKLTVEQIEKIYKDAYEAGFEHGKSESVKEWYSIPVYRDQTIPEFDITPKIYC